MGIKDFTNKAKPHGRFNSAPPFEADERHLWESIQLYSVIECLKDDCSILDFGCGGNATLQYTLFNHHPDAKYYGLEIENVVPDNKGFNEYTQYQEFLRYKDQVYLGNTNELDDILPKVDAMVMGSVFTHLGPNKMIEILDKTLPHYERGFQLGFTVFLGNDFTLHKMNVYGNDSDTWGFTIIPFSWFEEYCSKHNLEIILQDYEYNTRLTPFLQEMRQSVITIKKNKI